jgi:AcrR family transcriptional regulator
MQASPPQTAPEREKRRNRPRFGSSHSTTGHIRSMLVFMRALPGWQSRASLQAPPASVTRSSAHADQRRRILRAVGELVGERGYGDVTVELIVKRAHVSFKTFYKHFASKEDCFIALFDSVSLSTETTIRERLAAEPAPWSELVVLALRTLFELIAAEPLIARAVIVGSPTVSAPISARYEQASSTRAAPSSPRRSRRPSLARSSGPPTSASSSVRPTSCRPPCRSSSSSSSAPISVRPRQAASLAPRCHSFSPPSPDPRRLTPAAGGSPSRLAQRAAAGPLMALICLQSTCIRASRSLIVSARAASRRTARARPKSPMSSPCGLRGSSRSSSKR